MQWIPNGRGTRRRPQREERKDRPTGGVGPVPNGAYRIGWRKWGKARVRAGVGAIGGFTYSGRIQRMECSMP